LSQSKVGNLFQAVARALRGEIAVRQMARPATTARKRGRLRRTDSSLDVSERTVRMSITRLLSGADQRFVRFLSGDDERCDRRAEI
jgi:hypothetical protein